MASPRVPSKHRARPAGNLALRTELGRRAEPVWVLDSDCVIVRPDALSAPLTARPAAAIIGESQWDRWHNRDRLATFCLHVDKRVLARDDIVPFDDGGDPASDFLASAEQAGLTLATPTAVELTRFGGHGFVVQLMLPRRFERRSGSRT